jgi:pyruvate/2-oxoglutarate dehydrogenase complex dihydrolipoamide acyltransferase (E2) component
MPTKVTMPQLGESVVEGTVTRWLKSVGEQIEEYEPLLEVNTDKVDSEIPSPISGKLLEILVPEGTTVQAGELLALIGDGMRMRQRRENRSMQQLRFKALQTGMVLSKNKPPNPPAPPRQMRHLQ